MAKLSLVDLANLESQTTAIQAINSNNADIEDAIENTLSRDGTFPNTMGAEIDMNSHRIINLPAPVDNSDAVRLVDLTDAVGGLDGIDAAEVAADAAEAAASAAAAAASAVLAASYVGAASSAPSLSLARNIAIIGDATGNEDFDGTADIQIDITLSAGAAVTNIGYTPANTAGATFSGEVVLTTTGPTSVYTAGFRGIPVGTHDADYTTVLADVGFALRHTSASAHTWTVPPHSSVAYPTGAAVLVRNVGAGAVTIARGAGVTIRLAGTSTSQDITLSQWGLATLHQEDTNTWVISGVGIA